MSEDYLLHIIHTHDPSFVPHWDYNYTQNDVNMICTVDQYIFNNICSFILPSLKTKESCIDVKNIIKLAGTCVQLRTQVMRYMQTFTCLTSVPMAIKQLPIFYAVSFVARSKRHRRTFDSFMQYVYKKKKNNDFISCRAYLAVIG